MSARPFLSVVMPVHNGEEWIGATLESLISEAASAIEIIIIDSSPTRATAEIVERYLESLPIRFLSRPDLGSWQVKTNLGIELAGADHVAMLHQDDLWLPGRISAVRRWLSEAPQAALHLAPSVYVDRNGKHLGRWQCPLPSGREIDRQLLLERLLVQNFVSAPAPVILRSAWLTCGGLDDALWYTADWDLWLKLASGGPVLYRDEITTGFRIHGTSLTVSGSRDAREFRDQMQTVLERHLCRIPAGTRSAVEQAAKASIDINVSLAAASDGSVKGLLSAAANILSLGPAGIRRYFRDSRLYERVMPRVRARMTGAF